MRGSEGFTDKEGRSWLPDPTGRFGFRCKDGDRWTELVRMSKRQVAGQDPEGAALLEAGIGDALVPDDPRTNPDPDAVGARPQPLGWEHRVVAVDLSDLQRWLSDEGTAGWEAVSVLRTDGMAGAPDADLVVVVKRRVVDGG